ncbi:hypothetical protein HF086_005980 [Spodoptera exigua]|uniref:Transposase Helix-turn-helix domain-containing protein n=1 Tax=Spodoptera exigua TaxID=7107 RepID=A0A922M768_SPOEX|nr:hypothetical protein HF086_005980 [Spodoptera exigua]
MVDYHHSPKQKQSNFKTNFKTRHPVAKAIPARIRLAITLRYLATGDDYGSLHYLFKVSPQAISEIIPEVCHALCEVLKDEIKVRI